MENLELKASQLSRLFGEKEIFDFSRQFNIVLKSHFPVDIVDVTSDSRLTVKIPVLPAKIEMRYSELSEKSRGGESEVVTDS